ncbi:flavodoxin family protein [Pelotomaculum propionicicum]|uniref:flavodoxin family protein n=1 Tax=Pelotomaculum propionicicum TaxID=258475 RepID=UPI003B81183C
MSRKVIAIIGSPRKGRTFEAVGMFEKRLKELGNIDFEYVFLKDVSLKECRGCGLCLEKGEEFCPLEDNRADIFARMMKADGVIFATPVYSLQVTALLKNLLDRLAYVFHRPCFFHKSFMAVVTQGIYGVEGVLKYLDEVAHFWGFKVCPGLGLTVFWEKPSAADLKKIDDEAEKAAKRFYDSLTRNSDPVPSLKEVIMFRSVRAFHSIAAGFPRDHQYYREQGWLDSDYYYETRLGWHKKLAGRWVERQALKQAMRDKMKLVESRLS